MSSQTNQHATQESEGGYRIYTPLTLKVYDWWVLGLSNQFLWQCPSSCILDFYQSNIGGSHLDIGVGTGYFLKKVLHSTPNVTHLTLADANPSTLTFTKNRLRVISQIQIETRTIDLLNSELDTLLSNWTNQFQSIGLNYVFHCLPGGVTAGDSFLPSVSQLLSDNGVFFGSTILPEGMRGFASKLNRFYNQKRIFGNADDTLEDLSRTLNSHFQSVEIQKQGHVALFKCRC